MDSSISKQLQIIRDKIYEIRKAVNGSNFTANPKCYDNPNQKNSKKRNQNVGSYTCCDTIKMHELDLEMSDKQKYDIENTRKRKHHKETRNHKIAKCPKCGFCFEYGVNGETTKYSFTDSCDTFDICDVNNRQNSKLSNSSSVHKTTPQKEYSSVSAIELKKKVNDILTPHDSDSCDLPREEKNSDNSMNIKDENNEEDYFETEEFSKSNECKKSDSDICLNRDNLSIKATEIINKLSDINFEEESICSCFKTDEIDKTESYSNSENSQQNNFLFNEEEENISDKNATKKYDLLLSGLEFISLSDSNKSSSNSYVYKGQNIESQSEKYLFTEEEEA